MSEQETTTSLNEGYHHHDVRIHIDRMPYDSPTPTTGIALYILGSVVPENVLFREVEGDHEDKPIPRGEEIIHLHKDEHFYSAVLEFEIIVNGRKRKVFQRELSYEQLVKLAYASPSTDPNVLYKVTYRNGCPEHSDGALVAGEKVRIKEGMIFVVTPTNQS